MTPPKYVEKEKKKGPRFVGDDRGRKVIVKVDKDMVGEDRNRMPVIRPR